ncbi:unnamed protein product, partial [Callosobruchus maculatus]
MGYLISSYPGAVFMDFLSAIFSSSEVSCTSKKLSATGVGNGPRSPGTKGGAISEMHKIIILQMIGYGDNTRTQKEVARLFHEKFPNLLAVSQGTISKIEKQFRELGHVRQIKKCNVANL